MVNIVNKAFNMESVANWISIQAGPTRLYLGHLLLLQCCDYPFIYLTFRLHIIVHEHIDTANRLNIYLLKLHDLMIQRLVRLTQQRQNQ